MEWYIEIVKYLKEVNALSVFLRLTLALFCGGILGMERGKKNRLCCGRNGKNVSVLVINRASGCIHLHRARLLPQRFFLQIRVLCHLQIEQLHEQRQKHHHTQKYHEPQRTLLDQSVRTAG